MTSAEELTADYVVVGSGAGGGPVAARLAEAGFSVIIVEAGSAGTGSKDLAYSVPAFHAHASESKEMAWNFYVRHYENPGQAVRDKNYQADRLGVLYPRCAAVGGCTAHNAMIIVRPNDADWDRIADLTGDRSWTHEKMVRYFERLERCAYRPSTRWLATKPRLQRIVRAIPILGKRFDPDGHGFGGWLPTAFANPLLLTRDLMLLGVVLLAVLSQLKQTLGRRLRWSESLPSFVDPNRNTAQTNSMLGAWLIPLSVDKGRRSGTRELLQDSRVDHAVRILHHTLATKLIIDEAGRCTGVRALRGAHLYGADPQASTSSSGEPIEIHARREVIVAGGAFNTPQLLKLSGIGPAEELGALDIEVRVDSPGVGANLQDRYEVGVVTKLNRPFSLIKGLPFHPPQPGEPPDRALADWRRGKGPYRTNGGVLAVMVKSSPELTVPDLFMFALPANFRGYYPGYSRDLELTPDHLTWAVLKAHTHNRAGTVTLRSADPLEPPDIAFRYFEEGSDADGSDLVAMVQGVRFARGVTSRLKPKRSHEVWPGPEIRSDDEIAQWVRDGAWGHHACGTCAIGPDGDPRAVLDSDFRVRGVPGLRVVDASIFPTIPGYFIVTSVYMIGEKAADTILADARTLTGTTWPTAPPSASDPAPTQLPASLQRTST